MLAELCLGIQSALLQGLDLAMYSFLTSDTLQQYGMSRSSMRPVKRERPSALKAFLSISTTSWRDGCASLVLLMHSITTDFQVMAVSTSAASFSNVEAANSRLCKSACAMEQTVRSLDALLALASSVNPSEAVSLVQRGR